MPTLHIEHQVADYDAWKALFDSDPADRKGSGVLSYRVARGADDPNLVYVDLEFADRDGADALLASLRKLWSGPAGAMLNGPTGTVVSEVESVRL
jgi:hypothetical protein